jgi:hypothetical protein
MQKNRRGRFLFKVTGYQKHDHFSLSRTSGSSEALISFTAPRSANWGHQLPNVARTAGIDKG